MRQVFYEYIKEISDILLLYQLIGYCHIIMEEEICQQIAKTQTMLQMQVTLQTLAMQTMVWVRMQTTLRMLLMQTMLRMHQILITQRIVTSN